MARPRHQNGWLTEHGNQIYGNFWRHVIDPATGERKKKQACVPLGKIGELKKWKAREQLKGTKISRLIAEGLNEKGAEESVDTVDSERAAFIEKYFHMKWPNRPVYHAMLNTVIGVDGVIDSVLGLEKTLEQRTRAIA